MSIDFYNNIQTEIESLGFKVVGKDFERPWGGFLVIDEAQTEKFVNEFFEGIDIKELMIGEKLSPKILIVKPKTRLSWQYHNRRAEIWQVYKGEVGVIRSNDNTEGVLKEFSKEIKLN
jgi:mannose-6-phosphate isomerase